MRSPLDSYDARRENAERYDAEQRDEQAGEPAATTPQLTKLHTVIGRLVEHGQDKDGLRDTILSEYGITSTKSLTKREAGEVIDKLERLLGEVSNGKEGTLFS